MFVVPVCLASIPPSPRLNSPHFLWEGSLAWLSALKGLVEWTLFLAPRVGRSPNPTNQHILHPSHQGWFREGHVTRLGKQKMQRRHSPWCWVWVPEIGTNSLVGQPQPLEPVGIWGALGGWSLVLWPPALCNHLCVFSGSLPFRNITSSVSSGICQPHPTHDGNHVASITC